jgi:two-component system, NarL family, nitrate/nitrite response regulator NarL
MREPRITVVIADDHPVYLEGLAGAIRERPDLELVGQAAEGREAIALLRERKPTVAVIDVRLPELDGIAVLADAKRSIPATHVLLLSAVTEGSVVYDAIRDGADGFVAKTATRATICDAIRIVARGETYISPELSGGIAQEIRRQSAPPPRLLTAREQEILRCVASGLKVHEVAAELHLSVSTVKTHQEHIYAKLGVSGAPAAVAESMRRGLLD